MEARRRQRQDVTQDLMLVSRERRCEMARARLAAFDGAWQVAQLDIQLELG